MTPNATWDLTGGTAHVYLAKGHSDLTRPLVLLAPDKPSPTDLAALAAGLDSFRTDLLARDHDLILVGYHDGAANLHELSRVAEQAVLRSVAERRGDSPLTVGGIGRGALVARYVLDRLETMRMDHQTSVYFSYNGTAPAADELPPGGLNGPQRPMKLKLVSAGFTDELSDDDFDESKAGAASSGSSLITQELGQSLIDKLP